MNGDRIKVARLLLAFSGAVGALPCVGVFFLLVSLAEALWLVAASGSSSASGWMELAQLGLRAMAAFGFLALIVGDLVLALLLPTILQRGPRMSKALKALAVLQVVVALVVARWSFESASDWLGACVLTAAPGPLLALWVVLARTQD